MEMPLFPQASPHFSHSEINAIPFNGQQAVTAITALWLWCPTAFRWLQQPIGRHLVIDVAKQVIQRHPEVKNEGIPEALTGKHPIRPTSPRFRRSRQPEPGRRSTYPPKNLFRQAEPPQTRWRSMPPSTGSRARKPFGAGTRKRRKVSVCKIRVLRVRSEVSRAGVLRLHLVKTRQGRRSARRYVPAV